MTSGAVPIPAAAVVVELGAVLEFDVVAVPQPATPIATSSVVEDTTASILFFATMTPPHCSSRIHESNLRL